jgi:uncharacterized membrane protein
MTRHTRGEMAAHNDRKEYPMRKVVSAAITLILFSISVPAFAQEGPPQPVQVIAAVLQLSESQIASWLPILRSREEALMPLHEQLRANQEAIGKALQSPAPDAQTIGELFIARRAMETNAAAINSDAAAQFEAVLTPDQRERLHQIREASHVCAIAPAFGAAGLL